MKLHTNTRETNIGFIFSKAGWYFDYQLELTEEEQHLVTTYNVGRTQLGEWRSSQGDRKTVKVKINEVISGCKNHCFDKLSLLKEFEESLKEGCVWLKGHLDKIRETHESGPTTTEF